MPLNKETKCQKVEIICVKTITAFIHEILKPR